MKPKPQRKGKRRQASNQQTKPKGLPNATRTPGTIIRKMGQQPPVTDHGSNLFLNCRLNPFGSMGKAALPDGSNANFVVTDSFAYDVITFSGTGGAKTFILQTTPTLPHMALVGSTSDGFVVNGVPTGSLSSYAVGAVPGQSWTPICIPAIFNTSCVPGSTYADPWTASTMRFTNMAFRIVYTGPVTTCAGSITVTPNNMAYTDANATTQEGLRVFPANQAGTAQANAYPRGTPMLATDISVNEGAFTRASRTFRPEQGVTLICRHTGSSYDNVTIGRTPYVAIATPQSTGGTTDITAAVRQITRNGIEFCGIACYDNNWGGFQVTFNNINPDASFRIESMVCMEVCPMVTSPYYPMTQQSSPKADPKALDAANEHLNKNSISSAS